MTAPRTGERRQFRALVRLFAYRFFDTDIISVRGDLSSLLSQFAALLAALSLVLVMVTGPKYAGSIPAPHRDRSSPPPPGPIRNS